VLSGCEYFFTEEVLTLMEAGAESPLTHLNGSRHLLVEFPPGHLTRGIEALFHEMLVLGTVPVIAHPERNRVFVEEPERLARLVEIGALVQLTAGSLLGDFGRPVKSAAHDLLRRGLAHVVASDAHSLERRAPRQAAARELVRRSYSADLEDLLFERNPGSIVRGEALD
jgi:protein-tyrosine phosphatase